MTIFLKKFGATLNDRQFGREALAAFEPTLKTIKKTEKVVVDFDGVVTFTPSWGDEFLRALVKRFGKRLTFKNTDNLSVKATLKMLEKIYKFNFEIKEDK